MYIIQEKLQSEHDNLLELRTLNEGYPYVTENGNFVLDTLFHPTHDVRDKEIKLKSISDVLEVGLFTKYANVYYKAKDDGSFDRMMYE